MGGNGTPDRVKKKCPSEKCGFPRAIKDSKGTSGHMVFQSSVIFVATPHFLACLAYGLPSCVFFFFCFVLGFKVVAHF